MKSRRLSVIDLGRAGYQETLILQRTLREARLAGSVTDDLLLLVEHDPVYTLGRGTRQTSLPIAPALLEQRGAEVVEIERGGDVTWHGPGQLVGYPILDLRTHQPDLHWYLRCLETMLCDALDALGLQGSTVQGKTGVWVDSRKIASLGIHVRQWVTLHGFALNVDADLSWFRSIVPCGLSGVEMTSVAREHGVTGRSTDLTVRSREAIIAAMANTFHRDPEITSLDAYPHTATQLGQPCDSTADAPTFMHHG